MAETSDAQTKKSPHGSSPASASPLGMVGLAYASVPLYDLFCKVTGFNGTPISRADNGSSVMDRTIAVRFDANVAPGLNWRFAPETPEVKVEARRDHDGSTTGSPTRARRRRTGIATYNVQPDLAGSYFSKLECFCFTEQTLKPGETLESAGRFLCRSRIVEDTDIKDIDSITLSYTYFPSKGGKPVAEAATSPQPRPIVQ